MKEQKGGLIAKFLHKPYHDYCSLKKEQFKLEHCLWIYYIKPPKNDNNTYSYYAEKAKSLNTKCRTILFYDIPIRLSKQQFCMLYILLADGNIQNSHYEVLSNACNDKKMTKSAAINNLKCFVSDFTIKIRKTIANYKDKRDCYFTNMTTKQIKEFVKNFIYYERFGNGYAIKISCSLVHKERVKKC